ncbi:MAG: hypothetical protein LBB44_05185 [Endomicrobium sp.]|jgi:hypothetical protein|nr:hypothetical protein [Endomicrobium sp.]
MGHSSTTWTKEHQPNPQQRHLAILKRNYKLSLLSRIMNSSFADFARDGEAKYAFSQLSLKGKSFKEFQQKTVEEILGRMIARSMVIGSLDSQKNIANNIPDYLKMLLPYSYNELEDKQAIEIKQTPLEMEL